jgi:hypothetical protein
MKTLYWIIFIVFLVSCNRNSNVKESHQIVSTGQQKSTFSQERVRDKSYNLKDTAALMIVDQMPEFHGYKGRNSYERTRNFIDANLRWPTKDHLNGDVFIAFVVELDGSLSHFRLLRGFNSLYDNEALRVIKLFPKWKPGSLEGIKVRVFQDFLVRFSSKKEKELLYKSKSERERVNQKDYSENSLDIDKVNQKEIVNYNYFASHKKPGELTFLDYDVIVPDIIRYGQGSQFYDRIDHSFLFYLDKSSINVFLKINPRYLYEKSIDTINYTPGLFIRTYPETDFKGPNIKEFFNDKWTLHLALLKLDGGVLSGLEPEIYVKFNNTAIFTLRGPTWSSTYKAFLMNGKVSIWELEETIE